MKLVDEPTNVCKDFSGGGGGGGGDVGTSSEEVTVGNELADDRSLGSLHSHCSGNVSDDDFYYGDDGLRTKRQGPVFVAESGEERSTRNVVAPQFFCEIGGDVVGSTAEGVVVVLGDGSGEDIIERPIMCEMDLIAETKSHGVIVGNGDKGSEDSVAPVTSRL